jgi:hypothetical protein
VRRILDGVDFASRIVFFAVAPFLVFVVAALFPITMTLANLGVCVVSVVFINVLRSYAERFPILDKVVAGPMKFERYYRLHPPKPFAYYIFFPLLFPYWLSVDHARREFVLYKTVNLATLAFVVLGAVYQYFAYFRPQLGLFACVHVMLVTLVLEIAIVMTMLMPLATSIIRYRLAGQRRRLVALVAVGALSTSVALIALARRRDPVISWAARERLTLRTKKALPAARYAQRVAAKSAWGAIAKHEGEVDTDGKVTGEPVVRARASLRKFYKDDEAEAFDAWLARTGKTELLVLYVETTSKRRPTIFFAMDRAGHEVRDPKKLPKGALDAMKLAADGPVL